MFEANMRQSRARGAFAMLELIYHSTVRDVRKTHRNAFVGLLMNMMQTIVFVLAFYAMFSILGMRGSAIRGDFLLYIMSGIFLFMTHTKAMAAVVRSEGPASPMMQHAPMTTFIAITAAALSSLYLQLLSLLTVLFIYHVLVTPVVIDDPFGAMGMLLAAWFSGCGVGMIFLAIKPWAPDVVTVATNVYARVNMVASGKMFVANSLPSSMLALFDWNPLFHTIDQARGYIFLHYNPHFSSAIYPVYIGLGLLMIGMMGEFYTRRNASISWNAGR
ncbi:ABC-type polysaccharide/polyol phosphate export permease [Cognatiyoonia koreensis]|uniref:ABC-type polysaccharide/polyol phosphate export permease n=1 Tax=Cognatiyoonia koreensis TaxID=364200 RepID=A0A1I0RN68_9RHOB|nr:ABC transporter permease [Cognatiyoonia koreensis]SEW42468.1 ABC-type polysaccharide/polyol phosphate export permease [Cognatiyoonia koreensis]